MTGKKLLRLLNPRLKWRGIRGIRYNEDGVSAVEFAMIAPLMVLLFLGCVELSFMMRADRRVTTTSASLGDLTARLATVTDADMNQMFAASSVLMQPLDVDDARLRITSIVDDGDGIPKVDWSESHNWTARSQGSTVSIPAGIVPSPGSVVLAEVEYDYESKFGYVISVDRTLTDKFYLRPRRVNVISRNTEDSGNPFGPSS